MSNEPIGKKPFGQSKRIETAQPIYPPYTLEEIVEGNARFKRLKAFENELTTNSYVDSLLFDCRLLERKLFHILNNHAANGLNYKILACVVPQKWVEIKAETLLAAASNTYEWDTEPWSFVKIQVKSAVADTPALCDAYIGGQT